jgi:hypothetical protein
MAARAVKFLEHNKATIPPAAYALRFCNHLEKQFVSVEECKAQDLLSEASTASTDMLDSADSVRPAEISCDDPILEASIEAGDTPSETATGKLRCIFSPMHEQLHSSFETTCEFGHLQADSIEYIEGTLNNASCGNSESCHTEAKVQAICSASMKYVGYVEHMNGRFYPAWRKDGSVINPEEKKWCKMAMVKQQTQASSRDSFISQAPWEFTDGDKANIMRLR